MALGTVQALALGGRALSSYFGYRAQQKHLNWLKQFYAPEFEAKRAALPALRNLVLGYYLPRVGKPSTRLESQHLLNLEGIEREAGRGLRTSERYWRLRGNTGRGRGGATAPSPCRRAGAQPGEPGLRRVAGAVPVRRRGRRTARPAASRHPGPGRQRRRPRPRRTGPAIERRFLGRHGAAAGGGGEKGIGARGSQSQPHTRSRCCVPPPADRGR